MKIERAIFIEGVFHGFYTLEGCDTYTLYNPKREHCLRCGGETQFHWRNMSESSKLTFFFLSEEDKAAAISKMIRLDLTRPIKEFIPFEEEDLNGN